MKKNHAFSLVELSVVIVIISILASGVTISRSLMDITKINKIKEEERMFNNAINIYFTNYGCLPGDCRQSQVPDLVSGINPLCFTTNSPHQACTSLAGCLDAIPLNTGSIETIAKTTCMMQSLQSGRYISGVNKNAILTDSIAGINLPIAKFSKSAAWDFRLFPPQNIAGAPYPEYELISEGAVTPMEFNSLTIGGWANKNVLLLRQATQSAGAIANMSYDYFVGGRISDINQAYGISAYLTQKLDLKFDDGKPYSGNIMGGLSWHDSLRPVGKSSCNTFNTDIFQYSISPNEKYLSSKDIARGCIVGFYMDMPT